MDDEFDLYNAVAKLRAQRPPLPPVHGVLVRPPTASLQPQQEPAPSQYLGPFTYGAQMGIRNDEVRRNYVFAASKLARADEAARTALKEAARAATPAIPRTMIQSMRPGLGPQRSSVDGAARTNPRANAMARGLGHAGRGLGVLAAAVDVVEIAQAKDKARAATAVAGANDGGIAGGIAGAEAGAALGLFGGPFSEFTVPAGAIIGGLAGSMGGGYYGHEAGELAYDGLKGPRRKSGGY